MEPLDRVSDAYGDPDRNLLLVDDLADALDGIVARRPTPLPRWLVALHHADTHPPFEFDPAWRTEVVVGLAREVNTPAPNSRVYTLEQDEWDEELNENSSNVVLLVSADTSKNHIGPVLADALEDAGCNAPELAALRAYGEPTCRWRLANNWWVWSILGLPDPWPAVAEYMDDDRVGRIRVAADKSLPDPVAQQEWEAEALRRWVAEEEARVRTDTRLRQHAVQMAAAAAIQRVLGSTTAMPTRDAIHEAGYRVINGLLTKRLDVE